MFPPLPLLPPYVSEIFVPATRAVLVGGGQGAERVDVSLYGIPLNGGPWPAAFDGYDFAGPYTTEQAIPAYSVVQVGESRYSPWLPFTEFQLRGPFTLSLPIPPYRSYEFVGEGDDGEGVPAALWGGGAEEEGAPAGFLAGGVEETWFSTAGIGAANAGGYVLVGNVFHDIGHAIGHAAGAAVHALGHAAKQVGAPVAELAELAGRVAKDTTKAALFPAKVIMRPLTKALQKSPAGRAVASYLDAPEKFGDTAIDTGTHVASALLRADPEGMYRAARSGTGELARNPVWDAARSAASFVPGWGTAISEGMALAGAWGKGLSIHDAALEAARAALPGGPAVQMAFDVGVGLAEHHNPGAVLAGAAAAFLSGSEGVAHLAEAALDAAARGENVAASVLDAAVQAGLGAGIGSELAGRAAEALVRGENVGRALVDTAQELAEREAPQLSEGALLALREKLPRDELRAAFDAGQQIARRAHLPPETVGWVRHALPRRARGPYDRAIRAVRVVERSGAGGRRG